MEEKRVEISLLLDFFGELLTEKQRECLRARYEEDLSLGEIAENQGISRQGVRDTIMRACASLLEYEEKTGVISRFTRMREIVSELEGDMAMLLPMTGGKSRELALGIVEKLKVLKE